MKADINELKNILDSKDIRPSLHRIKVLEYLLKNQNHPTVDMIYKSIINEIPTISKTTVYNTLKLFMENHLAKSITIEENECRYDGLMDNHAHFKCCKCNNIYDIDAGRKLLNQESINEHRVTESHLYYKGICSSCSD